MSWGSFFAVHAWELAALAALLGGSAFFSSAETALFNLSSGRLYRLAGGGAAGRIVAALMRRPARVLNTLLLGNMVANVAFTGISALIIFDLERAGAAHWIAAVASLAPLVALILLGESIPKLLALAMGERWALPAGGVLAVLHRVLAPVVWVLENLAVAPLSRLVVGRPPAPAEITPDELAAVLELSAKRGAIDADASALLQEIIELTDLRVADIMVPRVDMVTYDLDAPPEGLRELFRTTHLKKIPVYERSVDDVRGLVYAKRLFLEPDAALRDLVAPVLFVPEAANVERLLLQFRVQRAQTAIVVDEYGGTAGLVALEDVLEEIVGEIEESREASRGPVVERIGPNEYRLDGDLAIHEWDDAFQMDLASHRISTVGGFVTSLLGHIPRAGDEANFRNLHFTVESLRKRRIDKLRLTLQEVGP